MIGCFNTDDIDRMYLHDKSGVHSFELICVLQKVNEGALLMLTK